MIERIIVVNEELKPRIKDTSTLDIYSLYDKLIEYGWTFSNGIPTRKFEQVIKDINKVSPTTWNDGNQIWDYPGGGISYWNNFCLELTNTKAIVAKENI